MNEERRKLCLFFQFWILFAFHEETPYRNSTVSGLMKICNQFVINMFYFGMILHV